MYSIVDATHISTITAPSSKALPMPNQETVDEKLRHSFAQVCSRQGRPMSEVFADIERKHFALRSTM